MEGCRSETVGGKGKRGGKEHSLKCKIYEKVIKLIKMTESNDPFREKQTIIAKLNLSPFTLLISHALSW